jgi:hypothetical protein
MILVLRLFGACAMGQTRAEGNQGKLMAVIGPIVTATVPAGRGGMVIAAQHRDQLRTKRQWSALLSSASKV